jgi:hypothetical protein
MLNCEKEKARQIRYNPHFQTQIFSSTYYLSPLTNFDFDQRGVVLKSMQGGTLSVAPAQIWPRPIMPQCFLTRRLRATFWPLLVQTEKSHLKLREISLNGNHMVASGHGPDGCMETFPAVSVPHDLTPNSLQRRKKLNCKTMPKDVIEQSTLIA